MGETQRVLKYCRAYFGIFDAQRPFRRLINHFRMNNFSKIGRYECVDIAPMAQLTLWAEPPATIKPVDHGSAGGWCETRVRSAKDYCVYLSSRAFSLLVYVLIVSRPAIREHCQGRRAPTLQHSTMMNNIDRRCVCVTQMTLNDADRYSRFIIGQNCMEFAVKYESISTTRWSLCPTSQWRQTVAEFIYMEMNGIRRDSGTPRANYSGTRDERIFGFVFLKDKFGCESSACELHLLRKKMTPKWNFNPIFTQRMQMTSLHNAYSVTAAVAERYNLLMLYTRTHRCFNEYVIQLSSVRILQNCYIIIFIPR